jgi:hypothetical protein
MTQVKKDKYNWYVNRKLDAALPNEAAIEVKHR